MTHIGEVKASSAIVRGELPPPPALTDGMLDLQASLATENGATLTLVSVQTRYANDDDSPILLIDGSCLFELLDVWDPEAGTAQLAARRGDVWFRVESRNAVSEPDSRFLTWNFTAGAWWLLVSEQYVA